LTNAIDASREIEKPTALEIGLNVKPIIGVTSMGCPASNTA
jgi:hypothetical protein